MNTSVSGERERALRGPLGVSLSELPTLTSEAPLESARQLIPALRARAADAERLRRLPDETIEDARRARLFELLSPRRWGGQGGSLRDFVAVTKALAEGDPSAAWTLSFLISHHWLLSRFPMAAQEVVFANGPVALAAAVANPPGRAIGVGGGYRLTGRWPYSSAIMHSDWFACTGMTEEQRRPMWLLLPRDEVTVHDTWHTAGMRGTGSNDVSVEDVFVPSDMTIDFELWGSADNPGAEVHAEPLTRYDFRDIFGLIFPSVLAGAARAVLEGYRDRLAVRRLPFASGPQIDMSSCRARFGKAAGEVQTADILLDHATDTIIQADASGRQLSDQERVALKLELLNCAQTARSAVCTVIEGSGSSIYKTNDLTQHYKRDVDMILGHFTLDSDWVTEVAGTVLLGVGGITNPGHFF
ncbi:hypothetical protein OQ968_02060 [Mycobacterium sp. 663a-19]|uniref:hypothetical protein n=1 Tax=Mycobacterium sp. 663a-19 TaxID=2986148 RepID=UPI002D1E96E9|nr:hypothetical protein [Mycobacterium sp. 663a-19]MEB3980045.1 hypothetical protein [Mycobacterium sp. 663a-19]